MGMCIADTATVIARLPIAASVLEALGGRLRSMLDRPGVEPTPLSMGLQGIGLVWVLLAEADPVWTPRSSG